MSVLGRQRYQLFPKFLNIVIWTYEDEPHLFPKTPHPLQRARLAC